LAKDLKEAVAILRMHEMSRAPTLEFLHANEWKLEVEAVVRKSKTVEAKARESAKLTRKSKKEEEKRSVPAGADPKM